MQRMGRISDAPEEPREMRQAPTRSWSLTSADREAKARARTGHARRTLGRTEQVDAHPVFPAADFPRSVSFF
jgi:hypothetical protein